MGLFDLFSKGLAKTRDRLVAGLRAVLPFGRRIDEDVLGKLQDALLAGDIGPSAAETLMQETRGAWKAGKISEAQEILPFLRQRIVALMTQTGTELRFAASGPTVIFIVGVNGSGKTTSVAKLCRALTRQNRKVLLAACDTFRAAAIEQLTVWAQRSGVDIVKHQPGSDPAAVAFDACEAGVARGVDVILVDTAGRLHTQEHLMRELDKIKRVVQKRIPEAPHETLLVLDATIGQNALNQAKLFSEVTPVSGLFLAKLDGSAKGGVVIGIRDKLGIPVKFVGLGESIDDIAPFDAERFVKGLFGE